MRTASVLLAAALAPLGSRAAADATGVRAYESTETILTYEEGPPDVNPPFDLFTAGRFNYPYTLRESLTERRAPRTWRTLNLENEYLRVTVLPDLGGRLWRSLDKANGASMFYANPTLKFAQVAYRGAWATFGIEFNFPVSHSWVTSSPVDFATLTHPDGSASIVVGNIDLVYGMQWRVELRLRPAMARLEQTTTLYNRSDLRHRFYWWTNAAVEAWDDSKLIYPMEFTATHGFTHVDTWPVSSGGVDLSRPGNHLKGPVSLFSHGSREPFMGVYHPRSGTGVAHYADPADLPARKVWSWGSDADGRDWRKALSDNESAEVEIQAGLFRNQETYGFLEPQESVRFRELWIPVRGIGGFVKVTPDAVLNLERVGRAGVVVGFNVTRPVAAGTIRLLDGPRVLIEEVVSLGPERSLRKTYPSLPPAPRYTLELRDSDGRVLLAHTEGVYDLAPPSEIQVGPQARRGVARPGERSADEELEAGDALEREGKLLVAFESYARALRLFPGSFGLNRAAGRLAVALKRFDEGAALLQEAEGRVSNDAEVQYYLACARRGLGDEDAARGHWERALASRRLRPAALLQLGRLLARRGDLDGALDRARALIREEPGSVRAGIFEVILLRRLGRAEAARERLRHWRREDPTSSTLRHEAVRLGEDDPALWTHLAGDPQRVIEVALDYMELGAWDDALGLLERRYPAGEGVHAEAGMPAPQEHPEVAYYRGFCREKVGGPGRPDFDAASRMDTTYVFPHRAASLPVLGRALEANPGDATAHFLLGSLNLSGGLAEAAVREWEEARRLRPGIKVLHRNLGLTLLHASRDLPRALEVLREGVGVDPDNVQVYEALDQVLGLLGRPVEERLRALEAYPKPDTLPAPLVFKRALALVEAGRFDEAEQVLAGRFFPREEFGTNVRQVFVEVRIQEALARARRRECGEARSGVARLGLEVAGFPFTKDGLSAFVDTARIQYLAGEVHALCGDAGAAKSHWERAAATGDAYPQPNPAFALAAARRLGGDRPGVVRPRVEEALASWANRSAVGTNFPGPNACGQGLMLLALGREGEAREKLEEALRLPDRVLSHYLSRAALAREGGS